MNTFKKVEVNIKSTHIRQVDVQVRNLTSGVELSELSKVEVNGTTVYKYTIFFTQEQLNDVEKNLQGIATTIGKLTIIANNQVLTVKNVDLKGMI